MMRAIQLAVVCVAVLVATAGQVQAGIIGFSINQTWSQGAGQSDIVSTSVSLGDAGHFNVDPGFGGEYFDFNFDGSGTFSTIPVESEDYFFLRSYSLNEFIGPGNFGDHTSADDDWDTILTPSQTAGVWGASHDGYLGFRSDSGNFGWIDYSFDRTNSVSTMTLLDGAFESQASSGIFAGATVGAAPIPEPSSIAIFGIGACLVGFGVSRRRKRESASMAAV